MSSDKNYLHAGQGFSARANEGREHFMEALKAAFDYRGNVTLELEDDRKLDGYIYNVSDSSVEVWPADDSAKQRIPVNSLRGITFSGRDTAEGKSWEAWVKKYNDKKSQGLAANIFGDDDTHASP